MERGGGGGREREEGGGEEREEGGGVVEGEVATPAYHGRRATRERCSRVAWLVWVVLAAWTRLQSIQGSRYYYYILFNNKSKNSVELFASNHAGFLVSREGEIPGKILWGCEPISLPPPPPSCR